MKHLINKVWLMVPVFFTSQLLAQNAQPVTDVIRLVAKDWQADSSSCLGLRFKVYKSLLRSRPDGITKEELIRQLGKPDIIQKFFSGITRKNYFEYIYFTHKDNCPKIQLEGLSIGFVFDENGITLLEITEHEYCG